MPSVIPDVVIKRTSWGLIERVVVLTALCPILAGMASAVGGMFWVFLIIFWLPGLALVLMLQQARLTTTGDVLIYWVPLRTTRAWHREEIATFGLSGLGGRAP